MRRTLISITLLVSLNYATVTAALAQSAGTPPVATALNSGIDL